ncbi:MULTISPECIES: isochorismatase family cysteine hydrolase [unclassified Rhizobium]|uniref:cysteine hydrolase family protein n=1 Tax=unclassified Rhizobium TaxID=2613769 RepID=UPI00084C64F6|nr:MULTISPECIES: isochorismatase family cysteine hydrolase [unclassified Rhizobium]OEC95122.1 hydrolase [Rhizobium sp. YK2]QYA16010.1 cysteine hydrolase [Rhizobium sp. AB2/73]UEQ84553.1 cysteine hydrolase [Rhizobium sp. AB2/73]
MALTALDQQTALIVVDLQKGIMSAAFIEPIAPVIERAVALIRAFRQHDLPVVFVKVAGTAPGRAEQPRRHIGPLPDGFTDFIPDLDQQPGDIVVTKYSWGAFATTDLDARLKSLGVTQVVVIGVATGTGVEATARQAFEAGYNVALAIDAMTDTRPEAHAYSIKNVFPRLGETATTEEIMTELAKRNA